MFRSAWKKFSFVLFVIALSSTANAFADSIPLGDLIVAGTFGTSASNSIPSPWLFSGTGTVNVRLATDAINTTTGNGGFDNFFNSAFAVLGNNSGGEEPDSNQVDPTRCHKRATAKVDQRCGERHFYQDNGRQLGRVEG